MLIREEQLERLRAEAFDLVVVGGGITGAAAARDAAGRGFRTALIEARDFAEGTSSRSSRLVHGGLRYLEHFELPLVFEASRERRTLLRIAPHLVRPLEFFFPIYRDGRIGRLRMGAGMWLYDALSLFRNIERHQMLSAEEVLEREPRLRSEGLLGGARYFDAQVDDARLVVSTVIAAAEEGAVVANRLEATRIRTRDWPGHTVQVRDAESDRSWDVHALAVLVAAGPWTEEVLGRADGARAVPVLRSRGSHVHIRRDRIAHDRALIFESAVDGRIMFVLPWRELTLIGTTDEFDDVPPERVAPTATDVTYLLESTNRLFPGAALGPADVVSAWAGLRPLSGAVEAAAGAPTGEGEVSRDFAVHESPPGLFALVGGKLTSHRAMAEEAVDRVGAFLEGAGTRPRPWTRRTRTHRKPLPGGDFDGKDALKRDVRARAGALGVAEAGADRLASAYGTRAHSVLDLVGGRPELAEPLIPGQPPIGAEAVYAAREEMAIHAEDMAYRRTRLALEVNDASSDVGRRIARLMAEELGWDDARVEDEVERMRAIRARDEGWRTQVAPQMKREEG